MKKIELELTEQQIIFLLRFAKRQSESSPDNLETYKPIHLVEEKKYNFIPFHDDVYDMIPGDIVFTYNGTRWYEDIQECVNHFLEEPDIIAMYQKYNWQMPAAAEPLEVYMGFESPRMKYLEYFNKYHVDEKGRIAIRMHTWSTKSYHFTLQSAKDYVDYNHLKNARTNTVSQGSGNKGDYEPFWDLLMAIGQMLEGEERIVSSKAQKNISLENFKKLKPEDSFLGWCNGKLIQEIAASKAIYNVDADEPGWEIEAKSGCYWSLDSVCNSNTDAF